MYEQREKLKKTKQQVKPKTVNRAKIAQTLNYHAHPVLQKQNMEKGRAITARQFQPSPSTIQRVDDDKDKQQTNNTSENLDTLQSSLEWLGMIPGLGMFADGANVGISLFRGNYADALLNLAAMVPVVGQGVTGTKLGAKAVSSATDALGATKVKTLDHFVDKASSPTINSGFKGVDEHTNTTKTKRIVANSGIGDIYDPNFLGPVKWKTLYRGDASPTSEFISSRAQLEGADAARARLSSLTDRSIANELRDHSVTSQHSDFVSVTDDLSVAEHFARGINASNQNGVVSTFRIESREFDRLTPFSSDASLLRYNSDSDLTLFGNPALGGRSEREFLFETKIPQRYFFEQRSVNP